MRHTLLYLSQIYFQFHTVEVIIQAVILVVTSDLHLSSRTSIKCSGKQRFDCNSHSRPVSHCITTTCIAGLKSERVSRHIAPHSTVHPRQLHVSAPLF